MRKVAYIALLALLTACTNLEDSIETLSPSEGEYALVLNLNVAENSATVTRITEDANGQSQWEGGEEVAIRVGGTVKKYAVKKNGSSVTLEAAAGVTPFYWTNASMTVEAWYPYNNGTLPTSWKASSDQSGSNYFSSDLLYGKATLTFAGAKDLTMYHQMAKVVVNIKENAALSGADRIMKVTIGYNNNLRLNGTFTPPSSSATVGTWNTSSGTKGVYTPRGITSGSGILKSYAAMAIPQTISKSTKFIAVTLTGGETYYYNTSTTNSTTLEAGKVHTFDISLQNVPITASDQKITIGGDNNKYLIVGAGVQTKGEINIKAPATVTLRNVNSADRVNITNDGTVTIILEGENTLTGNKGYEGQGGIYVEGENTHIIVDGQGSGTLYVSGYSGAAIGSGSGNTCGDITIQNATINANGENIGWGGGACIGSGSNGHCKKITIKNSTITAKTKGVNGFGGACIGSGNNGSYGSIEIQLKQGDTKTQFLARLTVDNGAGYDQPAKVGKGNYSTGGGITWK